MALLTLTPADAGLTTSLTGATPWTAFGTDAADTFEVAAGTSATVNGGAGTDVVKLLGGSADYTVRLVGSSAVFTHTATGKTVSLPVTAAGDSVSFGTGTAVTLSSTGSTVTLGTQTLTTTSAPVTGASGGASGGGSGGGSGSAFTLTNSATADSLILTTGNDTVTGSTATMVAADTIIDPSTTDADVATFTLTAAAPASRIVKVETLNYNGDFATTGADLSNVSGAITTNFNTAILGGTAAVTLASAASGKIALGSGIGTFTTTTAATGTGGTVTVDLGTATTAATVTGSGVSDTYVINNPAAASALTLTGGAGATDNFTVNLSKGGTVNLTTATLENLTLNSGTLANTVNIGNNGAATLINGANAGTSGPKAVVAATTSLTLRADLDALQTMRIEKSGAGTFTVQADADTTAGAQLSGIAANVLDVRSALGAAAYTLNENTTLKLNAANVVNAANLFNIDNIDTTLAVAGTLNMDIANGQAAKIGFGALVGTVNITANTADLTATGAGVIADLDISTGAVTTAVLSGSKNVTITALNSTANDVFSASGLTGNLTVTELANVAVTIVGGSGNDTITLAAAGGLVTSNGGNDTIVSPTGASTVYGGDGTDSITTGAAADSIDGGAGVDNITTAAGADTVLGGAGADTINGGLGSDVLTGGTEGDVFQFLANTANESGGVPSATALDTITDWATGDKIDLVGTNVTIQATAAAAVAGTANISATGLATFAASDTTLALKLTAVEAALTAGTNTAGEAAVFVSGTDTYLYVADGTGGAANTDLLIKLTGISVATGLVIDASGDIIGIA